LGSEQGHGLLAMPEEPPLPELDTFPELDIAPELPPLDAVPLLEPLSRDPEPPLHPLWATTATKSPYPSIREIPDKSLADM
jgi:hypothetical protein